MVAAELAVAEVAVFGAGVGKSRDHLAVVAVVHEHQIVHL